MLYGLLDMQVYRQFKIKPDKVDGVTQQIHKQVYQSIDQSIRQPMHQGVNQPMHQGVNQPMHQGLNQPMHPEIHQPVNIPFIELVHSHPSEQSLRKTRRVVSIREMKSQNDIKKN